MDFETFRDSLAEDVREKLEGKTGEKYSVEVHNIDKMNESYEALTVKPENSAVGVNISATALYEQVQQGEPYESIADKAAFIVETALENRPDFNLDELTDYDKMKQTLAMEVVSAERNADLLERVPHRNLEDMAVVYRFVLNDDESGRGTILVTNKMLENYGVSADQLHEDAMKNAPEIKPAIIRGMSEVLGQQMGVEDLAAIGLDIPPEEEMMFVATVEGNIHGAGVIAYQDFMEKASERVGGGEFIGLRWQDVDMEKRTIDINHALVRVKRQGKNPSQRLGVSLPKTNAGIRVIPMLDQVYDAFILIKKQQRKTGRNKTVIDGMSGFIFQNANGDVLCEQNLNFAIRRITESYNMEEEVKAAKENREPLLLPHFSVHYLRHTFCTRLCENETNLKVIQSVMGHKSIRTTMDVYAEASGEKKQEAMQNLSAKWKEF